MHPAHNAQYSLLLSNTLNYQLLDPQISTIALQRRQHKPVLKTVQVGKSINAYSLLVSVIVHLYLIATENPGVKT